LVGHDQIVSLVVRSNAALALISWPFSLYDVFAKGPAVTPFQERLELKRKKLIVGVVLDMGDRLQPYLPQRASKIIIHPDYRAEEPWRLSEEAIEDMKSCLESHDDSLRAASLLKRIGSSVHRLHRRMYWMIFSIALESIIALTFGIFWKAMPTWLALALLGAPFLTATAAMICAGMRQRLIFRAEHHLLSEEKSEG